MKQLCYLHGTPAGTLGIATDAAGHAVTDLFFGDGPLAGAEEGMNPLLERAVDELRAYFAGTLRRFTLPVAPQGTPFQQAVWAALQEIPYGTTWSYGQLAAHIGRPRACRAVGMANHCNPIAIVIPCHRVIGRNGTLTGYASGLATKQLLLDLEFFNQDAGFRP